MVAQAAGGLIQLLNRQKRFVQGFFGFAHPFAEAQDGGVDVLRMLRLPPHADIHMIKRGRKRLHLLDNARQLPADALHVSRAVADLRDEPLHVQHAGRDGGLHLLNHLLDV